MVSLREYSRHRGVSLAAVQSAIASGRLVESVTSDSKGRRKLVSCELADQEWAANTRPSSAATRPEPAVDAVSQRDSEQAVPAPHQQPQGVADDHIEYVEARRRREIELWRQARVKREADELELAAKRGEVIAVAQARDDVIERFTVVKTRLLGVAVKVRQRCPDMPAAHVREINDAIREALEELAVDDG